MDDGNTEYNIVDDLYNEAEWFQRKADRMRKAAEMIENDDFDGDGDGQNGTYSGTGDREIGRDRSGNYSGRGNKADEVIVGRGGRGNQSFSDSNNADDARTSRGRQTHDAEQFSASELRNFLNQRDQRYMHEDGETFDRRTFVGRALYAAGMIDDDGYPTNNNRGRNSSGNNGRGRSNNNRARSTSNR